MKLKTLTTQLKTYGFPSEIPMPTHLSYDFRTAHHLLKVFYCLVASCAHISNGAILYNKFSVIFSVNHLVLDGTHNPLPMIMINIIIIILIITCMQGIYNYIPETNHVSMVYSVAAVLCLQFMLHIIERNASSAIICVTFLVVLMSGALLLLLLLLLFYDMYVSCHRHFFLVLLLNQR